MWIPTDPADNMCHREGKAYASKANAGGYLRQDNVVSKQINSEHLEHMHEIWGVHDM